MLILIFDFQCNNVLDPSLFIEWCKKDTCNGHPELACTAMEVYVEECRGLGFCIDWRSKLCPAQTCPSTQLFKPCSSTCLRTCESLKENAPQCPNILMEGCFCPEGEVRLV